MIKKLKLTFYSSKAIQNPQYKKMPRREGWRILDELIYNRTRVYVESELPNRLPNFMYYMLRQKRQGIL